MITARAVLVSLLSWPLQSNAQDSRSLSTSTIEVTELASNAPVYGTFGSHVPHVAANRMGIFVVYLSHEESDPLSKDVIYTWVLKRSVDGGKTFASLFGGTMHNKAPEIETDEADNIYLFGCDYPSNNQGDGMRMYIFRADEKYTHPKEVSFAKEAAGKYTAIYDSRRHQFYYFGFVETPFLAIDTNGDVVRRKQLFKTGRIAVVEYPFLGMDGKRLYMAWTTTPVGDCGGRPQTWHCAVPVYYSIHFIYSDDGGATWYAPGTAVPLNVPIEPDTDGPAPNIVPAQYLGKQISFLAGFAVNEGIAHFMYMVRPINKELYEAYDNSSFKLDHYVENARGSPGGFGGNGFMAFSIYGTFERDRHGSLYAITADSTKRDPSIPKSAPIIVLRSGDNGASWSEIADSKPFSSIFAINGPRNVSPQYGITGMFTAAGSTDESVPNSHQVYFFRVK